MPQKLKREAIAVEMVNILCGDIVSAFLLLVQLSKLLRAWLLQLSARMLFFLFCQPAHDLKKSLEKTLSGETKGETKFIKTMATVELK